MLRHRVESSDFLDQDCFKIQDLMYIPKQQSTLTSHGPRPQNVVIVRYPTCFGGVQILPLTWASPATTQASSLRDSAGIKRHRNRPLASCWNVVSRRMRHLTCTSSLPTAPTETACHESYTPHAKYVSEIALLVARQNGGRFDEAT